MNSDFDNIRELARDFATELRRKSRSQRTIDGYLKHIEYFSKYPEAASLPTYRPDITRDRIGGYVESLLTRKNFRSGEPLSPEYARGQYRSLQQFFKYLHAEEIIEVDPFARMPVPDAPEQEVPCPSLDASRAPLAECAGTSLEDTAVVRLFVDTGCRRGEIAPLDIDDLDFTENTPVACPECHADGLTSGAADIACCRSRGTHPEGAGSAYRGTWDYMAWIDAELRNSDRMFGLPGCAAIGECCCCSADRCVDRCPGTHSRV